MSKSELRDALNALRVGEPFRLRGTVPVFTHPVPAAESNPGSNEIPDQKSTRDVNQILDANPSRDETRITEDFQVPSAPAPASPIGIQSGIESTSPVQNLTRDRIDTPDTNLIPDKELTPDRKSIQDTFPAGDAGGEQIPRSSQPRKATDQDKAVLTYAHAETGLSRGYTRIPNAVLMRLIAGEVGKNEMQVVLLLARMTISFRRELTAVSKTTLQRVTGIQGTAAMQAINSLETKGWINRIRGDERNPTRAGLRLPANWEMAGNPDLIPTRDEFTPGDTKPPTSPIKISSPLNNKKLNKEKEENPLSLMSCPEPIRGYFAGLKPEKKREAEWADFQILRRDFSDIDIAACVEHLAGKGTSPNGAVCHSPMAYLAKAIGQVLAGVNAERSRERETICRGSALTNRARADAEEQDREEREWGAKASAFDRQFSDASKRRQIIVEYVRKSGLTFRPGSEAGRRLAISAWWSEQGTE
ncbi:MAG: replication protein [Bdellovibrionota bacterium]